MSCSSREIIKSEACGPIAHSAPARLDGVLAVIVLYNRAFKDVPCAQRLMQWLAGPISVSTRLSLAHCLIYDNSPVAQSLDFDEHERIDLFHDPSNGGTRAAYLLALKIAEKKGYPWILFLDHDTDLPQDFFLDAAHALATVAHDAPVCAVVPRVFDGLASISPSWITSYGRVYAHQGAQTAADDRSYWTNTLNAWAHQGAQTAADDRVGLTAIASASIVRTESLAAVLPIPAAFSLDYLDHWLFRELQRRGEAIAISSARVEHSLSVQSMNSMGIDRYRSILAAELAYMQSGPQYSLILHLLWHMGRTIKLMISTRRPALAGACARAALNILRTK